jgi:hypothetical protein
MSDATTTHSTKFHKKPIVVDAMRWNGDPETLLPIIPPGADGCKHWPGFSFVDGGSGFGDFTMKTPQGTRRCNVGDWIMCDAQGKWSCCTDEVFRESYEPEEGHTYEESAAKVSPGYDADDSEPLEPDPENANTPDDDHTPYCDQVRFYYGYCSCGLESKRRRLEAEKPADARAM